MNRIVSIEDKKSAIDIEVGGRTFTIERVVLFVHELYQEYYNAIDERITTQADISPMQRMKLFIELRKQYIEPIMAAILEENGYEYDHEWWLKHVESYDAMDRFISECITKDASKKKEVAPESLTDTD